MIWKHDSKDLTDKRGKSNFTDKASLLGSACFADFCASEEPVPSLTRHVQLPSLSTIFTYILSLGRVGYACPLK